jgi:Ran GTPase-activating protein (RanGAP) involved in mRNA processing and transport
VKLIFIDLPSEFDGLGFMDSVFEFYVTKKQVASHNFLHLTFQEFLAAVYISKMSRAQRLEHFKRKEEGRLEVVLRFLAGLTKLEDFHCFSDLLDEPQEYDCDYVDHGISSQVSWVYEARKGELFGEVLNESKTIEFSCNDFFDSCSLGYCMAHCQCQWVLSIGRKLGEEDVKMLVGEISRGQGTGGEIIGLRGGWDDEYYLYLVFSISLEGLNMMFRELNIPYLQELALELPAECSSILWPNLSSLQHLHIATSCNNNNWRLDTLLPTPSLKSLTFSAFNCSSNYCLSSNDCSAVAHFITSASSLEHLSFEFVDYFVEMDMDDIDVITAALTNNQILKTLDLRGLSFIGSGAADNLENFIHDNSNLQYLFLPFIMHFAYTALQIVKALSHKPHLQQNNLGTFMVEVYGSHDVSYFCELVSDYSDILKVKEVVMHEIGDEGTEEIAEFLENDSTVLELNLNENGIGDSGALCLSDVLYVNSTLKILKLSNNVIGDAGVQALAQALHSNCTLQVLDLRQNQINDVGAKALAEALCHNSSLECLNLSGNEGIGEDGVCHLVQALTRNESIINRGTRECYGLVLDRVRCKVYALKSSEYKRVMHKITYENLN